ncbi:MAG: hypothetical protein WCQ70_10575 [Lentimicrobiaceae bacterium]
MQTTRLTSKEYFKTLRIVHFAIIAGITFFGLISYFIHQTGFEDSSKEMQNMLIYLIPMFVLVGYLVSNVLFRNRLSHCKGRSELNEKLNDYRSALIIRWAFLEGPAFLAIVAHLLTGNIKYLAWAGIIIFYLFAIRPTISKAVTDLGLNYDEEHVLKDNQVI